MNACERCVRGPEPKIKTNTYCRRCGDEFEYFVPLLDETADERIDIIGSNGNDGLHYSETVDHPAHYRAHPSGIECIQITEHLNFCLGNAIKYIWRADEKGSDIEDLRKAVWYLQREISRRIDLEW